MLRELRDQTPRSVSHNPAVFLVGCPRSGTTLLQRLVDAHPQIAITHEQCWVARYFKNRTGLTPEGLVTPGLSASLLEEKRFHKLRVSRDELERLLEPGKPVSYGFGWFLDPYEGHRRIWHTGSTMGFRTVIERFRDENLTIIILANRTDLDPEKLLLQVADLFLSATN